MKTVNLTLDETLWRKARVLAAQRDMSASALMREALREHIEGKEADADAATDAGRREREALAGLFESIPFEMGRKLSREELHER